MPRTWGIAMKNHRYLFLIAALLLLTTSCSNKRIAIQGPVYKQTLRQESVDPELSNPSPPHVAEGALTRQERIALQSEGSITFSKDPYAQELIRDEFLYLSRDVRFKLSNWIVRAERYVPYVRRVLSDRGLPQDLAYLPFIESGYNPNAYSRSGAAGVWQFMPFTGRRFKLTVDWWQDERRDTYKATRAAAEYLSKLHDMFNDWSLAVAAYNAGEGKISRAIKACGARNFFELAKRNNTLDEKTRLREETLRYVPRFAAMVKIANNFELLGFKRLESKAPELRAMAVPGGTDLNGLSKAAGMDEEFFEMHNGAFRRETTPPNRVTTVYVPVNNVAQVKQFFNSPKSRSFAGYDKYTIRRGDSWSVIAQRTGVDIATLKRVNGARSNRLYPGQRIMIPSGSTSMIAKTAPVRRSPRPARAAASRQNTRAGGSYRVMHGDTMFSLAKRFGCDVNSLMAVNNMRSPRELRAGQQLRIPGGAAGSTSPSVAQAGKASQLYRVRPGDTVWSIARRFSVSPHHLMRWNNLSMNDVIQPGDRIQLYAN